MYSRVSTHFARVFAVYSHTLRESCVPRVLTEYQCVFSHVCISRVPRWTRDRIQCITKYQVCIGNVLATYWRPCTQRFRESPNTCIRARITEYYTYVGGFTQTLLKYVYYRVFKRVLMLYHSLIHQECISENTAVYLDVLQRIQWKLCNTPNTLSIHN